MEVWAQMPEIRIFQLGDIFSFQRLYFQGFFRQRNELGEDLET